MSKLDRSQMIFAVGIALVMLVQVAVASPVCRCAVPVAPDSQPGGCCSGPEPARACSPDMMLSCCGASMVAEEPADAVVPADAGASQLVEELVPVEHVEPAPVATEGLDPGPEPVPTEPIYLRHASLLL
jgi:hypothetical protein